jgi:hypothetical protein
MGGRATPQGLDPRAVLPPLVRLERIRSLLYKQQDGLLLPSHGLLAAALPGGQEQ